MGGKRRQRVFISHGVLAVVLAVSFARFVLPGLGGAFNGDDPMNIYHYWSLGPWALARGLVEFYSTYSRPVGGLFFYGLYELAGLNPLPYHIVITALVAVNTALAYACASTLANSRRVGLLCALGVVYHAALGNLVYHPAFVFDVLCFGFYFAALLLYMRSRAWSLWRAAVLAGLYIAALESKEMAVTLPLALAACEFLHRRHRERWPAHATLWAITLIYIIGKTLGADALLAMDAYRPVFTWQRFVAGNTGYLNELFYTTRFSPWTLAAAWILPAALGFVTGNRALRWGAAFVVIAPLPVVFLTGRGGGCLYIPLFGWTLIVSTAVVMSLHRAAGLLAGRGARQTAVTACLVVLMLFHALRVDRENQIRLAGYAASGRLTGAVIEQLHTQLPAVPHGSQIAFLNDVFAEYDSLFIAELLYHDRTVHAWLPWKHPLPPGVVASMDVLIRYEGERLVVVKQPFSGTIR